MYVLQRLFCLILHCCVTAQLLAGARAGIAFTPGFLTAQGTIAYGVAAEWELPVLKSFHSEAMLMHCSPARKTVTSRCVTCLANYTTAIRAPCT
jgi:hypothetical protein